jgi:hypothetical protein
VIPRRKPIKSSKIPRGKPRRFPTVIPPRKSGTALITDEDEPQQRGDRYGLVRLTVSETVCDDFGLAVGESVGTIVGIVVGVTFGKTVGGDLGLSAGDPVGEPVGIFMGLTVGETAGDHSSTRDGAPSQ